MTSPRLAWTTLPSYRMVFAEALGYILEVHGSLVPLFGPPSSYAAVVRHIGVQNGPKRVPLGEFGTEDEAKLVAETWLVEQIRVLGLTQA